LRKSHFTLGFQGNSYISEFKNNYYQKKAKDAKLDNNLMKDLKASHFGFSDLKRPSLNTLNMTHFKHPGKPKQPKKGQYNGQFGKKRGKDTHFKIGTDIISYQTSQQKVHNG